jgi:hypothetical protein
MSLSWSLRLQRSLVREPRGPGLTRWLLLSALLFAPAKLAHADPTETGQAPPEADAADPNDPPPDSSTVPDRAALSASEPPPLMILEAPLLDATANLRSGRAVPSMAQSLALTKSFYEASLAGLDLGVDQIISPKRGIFHLLVRGVVKFPFVFLSVKLPGGTGWTHEEFHRAVMGRRSVSSRDEIYRFQIFSGQVSVSHLSDADLTRMKADHPRDFVRMQAAGYEALHEAVLAYQKDAFFRGVPPQSVFYLVNTINNIAYLTGNAEASVDERIDKILADEDTDVAKRDFTGPDFTGWVYDLFRPDEPYDARGAHPSGVGVQRYIRHAQLTASERSYLSKQGRRSYLSLIDPTLAGIDSIPLRWLGDGKTEVLFNVKHHLTSFGDAVFLNLFAKTPRFRAFAALAAYQNLNTTLPGLELQLVDLPVTVAGTRLRVSPRLMLWMQPAGQAFTTEDRKAGGLLSATVAYPLRGGLSLVSELEGKTAGWVASHAALEGEVTGRVGLSLAIR